MRSPTLQFLAAVLVLCATAILMRAWEDTGPWSVAMAAWVQAVGVVGAIGSAVWLADKQSRDAVERERRQAAKQDSDARLAALALARVGAVSVAKAIRVLELPRDIGLVAVQLAWREVENAERAIEAFPIPSLKSQSLIVRFYPIAGNLASVGDHLQRLTDDLRDGASASPSHHRRTVALGNLQSHKAMIDRQLERLRAAVEAADAFAKS